MAEEPVLQNVTVTKASLVEREEAREVLLKLLRYDRGDAVSGKLKRISRPQWEEIVQQAAEYRAAGLLYRRMKAAGPELGIPAEVMESLRRRYLYSASRNMRMYAILGKVLRKLKENQIEVIVLKGGFLAEAVYGDTALRAMDDFDLLVRPADVARAHGVLLEMGLAADEKSNSELSRKTSHYGYSLRDPLVFVEIHWNIDESPSPFRIDVEGLWERSQSACIAGVQVKALSPEDLILHICVHTAFRHLFACHGLQSMHDLAETIRHYGSAVDWEQLQVRALRWGAEEPACLALQLARQLAGAQVPQAVLRELRSVDLDPRTIGWCETRILANADLGGPVSENWGRLRASRGFGDRFRALLRTLFPRPEILGRMYAVPAGSRRVYLYYPVRLQHLLKRQARVAWRFARGHPETRAWVEGEGNRVGLEAWKRMMLPRDEKSAG